MKITFSVFIVLSVFVGCKNQDKAQGENGTSQADMTHNSENSLDWSGTYRGILPCADCEGIKTEIVLHKDGTYTSAQKYLGESDTVSRTTGKFEWNEGGSAVTLLQEEETSDPQYKVGENKLIMLKTDGEPVESELSEMYILEKSGLDKEITEKYWKLIELRGEKIPAPDTVRREPHFILRTNENRVTGNGGCNNLMGSYSLEDGNKIQFSKMASTMMACREIKYENEFLKVFEEVDSYSIKADTLILKTADTASLAKFTTVFFN